MRDIRVVCVVTCPPALTVSVGQVPRVCDVYAAMIDEELNDAGYIMPGLGRRRGPRVRDGVKKGYFARGEF